MTTAAIMMVRDEVDIIAATVGHLLGEVDAVIVADNGSIDGTYEALEVLKADHPDQIHLGRDAEAAYRQSEKMSALASVAARLEFDWVVPVDADEIWMHPETSIKDFLAQIPPDRAIVNAALFDHVATGADPDESNPIARIGWRRREAAPLHKVAVRPCVPVTIAQGNHGAHYAMPLAPVDGLIIRHFPYRSVEQMTRKVLNGSQALNAAPELPESSGKHWRDYAALEAANPGAVGEVFREWFWVADPTTRPDLIFDPCPR